MKSGEVVKLKECTKTKKYLFLKTLTSGYEPLPLKK